MSDEDIMNRILSEVRPRSRLRGLVASGVRGRTLERIDYRMIVRFQAVRILA